MTQLQQQLRAAFPSLPGEIKDLLLSEELNARIEEIGKRHGLDDFDVGILIRITVRLLSGILAPTQFVTTLIDQLDTERENASQIAQEINRDIFNPVKESLKQVHNISESAPSPKEVPTPSPYDPPAPVKKPIEKLNIPFSVSSALGNVPAPAPAPKTETHPQAMGNIFEAKLGGTFQSKSETVTVAGTPANHPRVPHKPTQVMPPPPTPEPPQARIDPYREAA